MELKIFNHIAHYFRKTMDNSYNDPGYDEYGNTYTNIDEMWKVELG